MIHVGDCREIMRRLIADEVKVQCVVTSPPYWGLRDYGVAGQIGMEPTLQGWLVCMVDVFSLVRELLADDGTLWLNMGDAYANDGKYGGETGGKQSYLDDGSRQRAGRQKRSTGLKPKDLMGQPWRVAFALQDAGWYLRQDIIWSKPNPMPESIRDRCTKSHEYLFLFSKSERYLWNFDAMQEPCSEYTNSRVSGWASGDTPHTAAAHARKKVGHTRKFDAAALGGNPPNSRIRAKYNASFDAAVANMTTTRNRRSVWTIGSEPMSAAHFATFPTELVKPCVLAGSNAGDTVFDPFMGSGTVAQVALSLGRQYLGCELNPDYVEIFKAHRSQQVGMAI